MTKVAQHLSNQVYFIKFHKVLISSFYTVNSQTDRHSLKHYLIGGRIIIFTNVDQICNSSESVAAQEIDFSWRGL